MKAKDDIKDDFWSKVLKPQEGCWEWIGQTRDGGKNGIVRVDGRRLPVHRVAWEKTNGSIPEGHIVKMSCGNGLCCRPDHMYISQRISKPSGKRSGPPRKISTDQIEAIKQRYEAGGASVRMLAKEYGVSASFISLVINGKRRTNGE